MEPQEKRRFCIHIGTPKTGTTSLQWYLSENYDDLLKQGILYPRTIIESPLDPRQQPLFACIYAADTDGLQLKLQRIFSELTPGTSTIIVSSEGFYHHTAEFSEGSWRLIHQVASLFSVRIIVFLRPQADYIESMYRQYMKNPRGINPEYGSSLTIQELMTCPRLRHNMDYYGSLMKWAEAVGRENIIVRAYSRNVIEDFLSLLQLKAASATNKTVRNISLTRDMAEVLRRINPLMDNQKRSTVISQMEAYLSRHPAISDSPLLSPAERRAITEEYQEGNEQVALTWMGHDNLFPDPEAKIDLNWEPLTMDDERMVALLGEYGKATP